MEKWVETRKAADYLAMSQEHCISPIVARILRNRDLISPQEINSYLSPGLECLNDPMMHYGMDRVIFVLEEKIRQKKKIRVIGDYDVDGICSTFILYKGLKFFGADADYCIPHRIEDGYGINIKLIQDAYDAGVDTIITCDNGISAVSQTEFAHSLGMTMIITDHHEVPYEESDGQRVYKLPKADAIVDPKMAESNYPFAGICGAYVAYQTVSAYAKTYGFIGPDYLELKEELTEFAALATVCDVMELKNENRALVCEGAKRIAKSKNLGMRSLIHVTELEGKAITPYHMGFIIGPCLNASGRLDTSLKAIELFLETDEDEAVKKACNLKSLNEERKEMTLKETDKAFEIVDAMEKLDKVIVVYLPDCHESLAGIIAGRVRERYVHPAFVVTKTEKGLKGSGRSIESYDMFASLNEVKEYLTKFGGHKLAAGISLEEDKMDELRKALNEKCSLRDEDFCETVRIDMELPFSYADINLARELEKLEPFGVGNEKPLFAIGTVTFISGSRIGKNKNVGKYKVKDQDGRVYEMIYFGNLDDFERYVASIYDEDTAYRFHKGMDVCVKLGICYQIDINTYRGADSVSLQLKHYR